jgi:hypothetical protein
MAPDMMIYKKIIITVILFLSFLSCEDASKSAVRNVAETFMFHIHNLNFEEAKKLATKEGKILLSTLELTVKFMPEEELEKNKQKMGAFDMQILSIDLKDDDAIVKYVLRGEEEILELKRIDGEWLVDFNLACFEEDFDIF